MDALRAWIKARSAIEAGDEVATRAAVPVELMIDGAVVPGAQIVAMGGTCAPDRAQLLGQQVLDGLQAKGVRAVYGVASAEWPAETLEALGFRPMLELSLRSFYLSLGVFGDVFESKGPHPLRAAAAFARRLRQKMIEVSFDDGWLESAARVSEARGEAMGLSVRRTREYLRWRYKDAPLRHYRLLVLRRNAGAGIDGYAVVEPFEPEPDRIGVRVVDHWSRSDDRVGDPGFMVELAMWCLAERASVVQALGVQGSSLDGLFKRTGGFKKAWSGHLWWRGLGAEPRMPRADLVSWRAGDLLDY